MLENNYTMPTEFLLVGFTDYLPLRVTLFLVFLIVYTLTVVGNVGLIILVNINSSLQTAMYYFLSNLKAFPSLAVCYRCFSLVVLLMLNPSAIHCSILLLCLGESVSACIVLAYFSGGVTSMVHVCLTFRLPFCGSNIINHFFCDIPPLLALSCTDTYINELLLFALCGFIQTSTFVVIFISYFCIVLTVLSIKSSGGRSKTFSTCASHLLAITLFYGTLLFMYLRPTTSYSPETDKVVAVFYTVVFPMFNPIIYSFRNKDVKYVLRKLLDRTGTLK
uniref:G-protein coupled receptors family 1 profile domain-containing protein n=1 Tax=Capra hircus TaxID=9925 RepID=A0A452G0P8_CAPHI